MEWQFEQSRGFHRLKISCLLFGVYLVLLWIIVFKRAFEPCSAFQHFFFVSKLQMRSSIPPAVFLRPAKFQSVPHQPMIQSNQTELTHSISPSLSKYAHARNVRASTHLPLQFTIILLQTPSSSSFVLTRARGMFPFNLISTHKIPPPHRSYEFCIISTSTSSPSRLMKPFATALCQADKGGGGGGYRKVWWLGEQTNVRNWIYFLD